MVLCLLSFSQLHLITLNNFLSCTLNNAAPSVSTLQKDGYWWDIYRLPEASPWQVASPGSSPKPRELLCPHYCRGNPNTASLLCIYLLTVGSQRNILNFASETCSTVPRKLCAPPSFWESLHCSIKHAQGFPMHQLIFHTPGPGLMRASKRT